MARSRRARQREAEARSRAAAARQRQQNAARAAAARPAPAPAAGPAPVVPRPYDGDIQGSYNTTIGFNNAQDTSTQLYNTVQQNELSNEYGIDDASNPFSKMKMLQQAYERDGKNQLTSFASQGQAFSGAYSSNKNFLRDQNTADNDALQREYRRQKQAIQYSSTQSSNSRIYGNQQAANDALTNQLGR